MQIRPNTVSCSNTTNREPYAGADIADSVSNRTPNISIADGGTNRSPKPIADRGADRYPKPIADRGANLGADSEPGSVGVGQREWRWEERT